MNKIRNFNSYDKSYIEIPSEALGPDDVDSGDVYVTFVKYDDPYNMLSSLPLTTLPDDGKKSFDGRNLNSALVGANVIKRKRKLHRLKSHIYVTFFHKRYFAPFGIRTLRGHFWSWYYLEACLTLLNTNQTLSLSSNIHRFSLLTFFIYRVVRKRKYSIQSSKLQKVQPLA